LLNEFLKEHERVQAQQECISELDSKVTGQEATIAQQQKQMDGLIARLQEQATQIQNISVQFEVSSDAPTLRTIQRQTR